MDLATVIRVLTVKGAKSVRRLDREGTIEIGRSANFTELDRNLVDVTPEKVKDTRVLRTFLKGEEVFRADL